MLSCWQYIAWLVLALLTCQKCFFSSTTVPKNVNSCEVNVNVCEYIDTADIV